jgi:glutathione S-transferase
VYGLADIGYVPWILRARSRLRVELDVYPALQTWIALLAERPAVAGEVELAAVR